VYGDKQSAMDRLITNFKRLSPSVRKRLTLENDDKASMYSVRDLMYIHKNTGIPIGPALGWQDLRTVFDCITARAEHGLFLAPNQTATKASWRTRTSSAT
jgi:hypothetical protein